MTGYRCCKGGAVPDVERVEITRMGDPEPSYMPGRIEWRAGCIGPLGGHDLGRPPQPHELVQRGRACVNRVVRIAMEVYAA